MEECRSCSNVMMFSHRNVDPKDALQHNVSITPRCDFVGPVRESSRIWHSGGDLFEVYKQ